VSEQPERRALVVDDSRAARIAAARLVEPWGVDVDLAEDGAAALRLLQEQGGYDFVLVDLRMPALNGHELVRLMRARADRTPVVVMTGSTADTREVQDVLRLGADDFLVKPVESERLREALGRVLGVPVDSLRAETPRVLAAGSQALAEALGKGLPGFVEVDRVDLGELAAAVERAPYRLVAVELGPVADLAQRNESLAAASEQAKVVLGVQPGAGVVLVTHDRGSARGFDACVSLADLQAATEASLYANAVRPLVTHDDERVVVKGFRAVPQSEATYFAVVGRRVRAAVALLVSAGAARLALDLSRVPARGAAVERLVADAVAAAAGRIGEIEICVMPVLRPGVERLRLPVTVVTPGRRKNG
jgi:CheY-like chemotaxis protein